MPEQISVLSRNPVSVPRLAFVVAPNAVVGATGSDAWFWGDDPASIPELPDLLDRWLQYTDPDTGRIYRDR